MNVQAEIKRVMAAKEVFNNDFIGALDAEQIFAEAYGPARSGWPGMDSRAQYRIEEVDRAISAINTRREVAIEQAETVEQRLKEREERAEAEPKLTLTEAQDISGKNNLSVSKVAAQVGIKSKDLIGLCQEHGLPHITHHNTMLWPKEIDLIHELCAKNAEALHA